jgi:hypothetical protein
MVTTVATIKAFKEELKPGDVLVSSMAPPKHTSIRSAPGRYLKERVFRVFSRKLQGDLNHSGLYAGDGKVIEMRDSLEQRSLARMAPGSDLVAVRPKVNEKTRLKAVRRARELLKKEKKFEYEKAPFLARLALADFVRLDEKEPLTKRIAAHKLICSGLIGHAYPKTRFSEKKPASLLMPRDIAKSHKTKSVARFVNPKRIDAAKRLPFEKGAGYVSAEVLRAFSKQAFSTDHAYPRALRGSKHWGASSSDELGDDDDVTGVGHARDDKGWYVRTHRARSKSYPSKEQIPDSVKKRIGSTG